MTKTIQQTENSSKTNIIHHVKSLPNKEQKNEEEENEIFELVLVDMHSVLTKCVKKNMYDPELKYICVSYRWGELNEQQMETPDYTAHITSFDLFDLYKLFNHITEDPDLKDIPYLWIDAISVDQQNHARKKETILKMNQIYQHATYILAVPDLHLAYLKKNTANMEIFNLIEIECKDETKEATIYKEIFNNEQLDNDFLLDDTIISSITNHSTQQQQCTNNNYDKLIQKLKDMNKINEHAIKIIEELEIVNNEKEKEMNELKIEVNQLKIIMKKKEKENKKKIYQYLAYLVEDWSNRAWVISEYQIAKEKYTKYGTPLKYCFISLFYFLYDDQPLFSYHFNDDDDDDQQSAINNKVLTPGEVNDPILFNQFIKSRFMQRSHLDMMLNSNATRNEDRFNAILSSWHKYSHTIKNKNTISDWNITDMTSVRLKLFDIMDDLWDKATLLLACSKINNNIFPTFASDYKNDNLKIVEKANDNNATYKPFEESLLNYISDEDKKEEAIKIKLLMDDYHGKSKPIWSENLTCIKFEPCHCYLSVKPKKYFIRNEDIENVDYYQNKLSLDSNDKIDKVLIPFFLSNLLDYIDYPLIYQQSSKIYLVGNKNKNKWILKGYDESNNYRIEPIYSDDYTFNIY